MADTGIIQKRFGLNYRPMGANGGKRFVWGGVDDAFRGNLTYTYVVLSFISTVAHKESSGVS